MGERGILVKRYRLYVDESGDHTYKNLDDVNRRYLGLTGIAIESNYYRLEFQPKLEALKQVHFPHNPDEPLILHREELCNHRYPFGVLDNPDNNAAWEQGFEDFVRTARFELFTIIIDKKKHKERYGGSAFNLMSWSEYKILKERYGDSAFHPYHYCLTCLLERYKGYLFIQRAKGDVLAEGRGGQEDLALKKVYREVWEDGTFYISAQEFQKVLTSKELKVKYKYHNIAGLQLADCLAHPSRLYVLSSKGKIPQLSPTFGTRLAQIFQGKYNFYGKVLLD